MEHLRWKRLLQNLQKLIRLAANCYGISKMLNTTFQITECQQFLTQLYLPKYSTIKLYQNNAWQTGLHACNG